MLVFFAFNPLVLIECLVSAHNDIPMIFFISLINIFVFTKEEKFYLGLAIFSQSALNFQPGHYYRCLSFWNLDRTKQKNKLGKILYGFNCPFVWLLWLLLLFAPLFNPGILFFRSVWPVFLVRKIIFSF